MKSTLQRVIFRITNLGSIVGSRTRVFDIGPIEIIQPAVKMIGSSAQVLLSIHNGPLQSDSSFSPFEWQDVEEDEQVSFPSFLIPDGKYLALFVRYGKSSGAEAVLMYNIKRPRGSSSL